MSLQLVVVIMDKAFSQFVLLLCDPGKLKITSRYAKQFIEKFGKDSEKNQ